MFPASTKVAERAQEGKNEARKPQAKTMSSKTAEEKKQGRRQGNNNFQRNDTIIKRNSMAKTFCIADFML